MSIKFTDEQLDREVLYLVLQHVGKANALERWVLVEKIYGPEAVQPQTDANLYDREIRYAVNRLRVAGHIICDLGDGQGRYLAANAKEFQEFFSYYLAPIKARSEVLKALKKAASEKWADAFQISMFDLDQLETV